MEAYGVEVKNVIDKVWTINLTDGKEHIFTNSECKFKYRDSIFKNKWKDKLMITHVSFNLSKRPIHNTSYGAINEELSKLRLERTSKNICHVVTNIRKRKLPNPNEIGNSGSFFKNPVIKSLKFKRLQDLYPDIIGYKISEKETKMAVDGLLINVDGKDIEKMTLVFIKIKALVLVNYGEA